MSTSKTLLTITLLILAFARSLPAAADDPPQPASGVGDLVAAINQERKIPELVGKLEQKLAKPGIEADHLARELLDSLDQITRNQEIRKYFDALVEQKKDRLAALLVLRLETIFLAARPAAQSSDKSWSKTASSSRISSWRRCRFWRRAISSTTSKASISHFVFANGYRDLDVPLDKYKGFVAVLGKVVLEPLPTKARNSSGQSSLRRLC